MMTRRNNMGRTAKIILWSVITAMVLALMLALFLAPGKIIGKVDLPVMTNYKYKNAEMYTAGNAEIATEGINRIDVDWVLGDVSMVLWDGKTVSVSEIGDFADDKKVHTAVIDGALMIKFTASGNLGMKAASKSLTVKIPETMVLSGIAADTVSADVSIDMKTEVKTVDIDTVSGSTDIRNLSGDSVGVDTTSGRITVSGATFVKAEFDSVSGRIEIDDSALTGVDAETVSGKINCSFREGAVLDELDFSSVSGDIELMLPANVGFEAKLSSVSGDLNTDFACVRNGKIYTCGDGSIKISADTTSGDLTINKK